MYNLYIIVPVYRKIVVIEFNNNVDTDLFYYAGDIKTSGNHVSYNVKNIMIVIDRTDMQILSVNWIKFQEFAIRFIYYKYKYKTIVIYCK